MFKTYDFDSVKANGIILSGKDVFIGKDEKRRNNEIIHIEFKYSYGNYCLFYKGDNEILKNVCFALEELLNGNAKTEKQRGLLYKILIQALHIVHHKNTKKNKSKLNGINSLSTACTDNCFCLERMLSEDSVCIHCYANAQQKMQLALQDRNTINGIILRNIVIPAKYYKLYLGPSDISKYFRFESFGDVANKIQALNYIEICKAFPRVKFAAWTKNYGIWYFAFMESEKPHNLSFIVSSNKVNKPELYHFNTYNCIDHIFTVYEKKYIAENNININCGGRACLECIKKHKNCYFTDTEKVINEQLK